VTVDKPETNRAWIARHGVRIPIIEDVDRSIAAAFGVALRSRGAKHSTFVIDADGTLHRVYPKPIAKGHASLVLEDCREIWGPTAGGV